MQNQMPRKLYILVPDKPSQIQQESASASAMISSVIKTCLGPKAMQKMVITKINSIEITNDGNSILREIDVSHPSARSIIELARTQDEEIGDGTTSVVILASEILQVMSNVLNTEIKETGKFPHPIKVCGYLNNVNKIAMEVVENLSLNLQDTEESIKAIVRSSVETKICNILKVPIDNMAYDVVKKITENGICDLKNNIKVEKILGGNMIQSGILDGIILNKDIIHPQMRKRIENPRIIILDTPLEYKKGESQTNYEFKNKEDFTKALEMEEKQIRTMCSYILNVKPDIVVCEKSICDLAMSILYQNNVTAIRRIKKTESVRLSKATGASIVNRIEDLEDKHVGEKCKLFEYLKCGEEYYSQFGQCVQPKACSVIIRGPTKDIMNELERNFWDAAKVAKNLIVSPKLVPGGGCLEMNICKKLGEIESKDPLEKSIYKKVCEALKVIPTVLLINSGVFNPLMKIELLEKEINKNSYNGINGVNGEIEDMRNVILEPMAVKKQIYASAFQAVLQLLRVDGIMESKR
ncbi:T-complex protein 1 subunit gamma (CCT3) [Vairimorpha necatrix]|uniref:T-complex protein 1 subunit gamma n=1 Tax=Vairimorpha necatrix TaxID=6039 RepID=A0AAX4JDY2_9MICR